MRGPDPTWSAQPGQPNLVNYVIDPL